MTDEAAIACRRSILEAVAIIASITLVQEEVFCQFWCHFGVIAIYENNVKSSHHLFVIKVKNRDRLMAALNSVGIGTSMHFIPVHCHPFYKENYNYQNTDFPVANKVYQESLSLPLFPDLLAVRRHLPCDLLSGRRRLRRGAPHLTFRVSVSGWQSAQRRKRAHPSV